MLKNLMIKKVATVAAVLFGLGTVAVQAAEIRVLNWKDYGTDADWALKLAGYSNDVFAYIPSRRVLREGGYEAGGAMIYMTTVVQPGPFTETVEERIIGGVHALLKRATDGN